jgi:flagellar biosynthesis GTPase FlhF
LQFLKAYGIWGILIVAIAFGLTEIIKIPVKKQAEKWAEKNGVDKIVITKWLFVVPLVLAFVGSILNVWANSGWGKAILDSANFDWGRVVIETTACASVSSSIYTILENFRQAAVSQKLAKLTADAKPEVAEAKATIANATVTEAQKEAALKKQTKETAKAAKENEKAQKKAERKEAELKAEAEKKAKQIAALESELEKLKGTDSGKKDDKVTVQFKNVNN